MDEEVIYLLNRFPKHKKLLMEWYTNNEEFRKLCQDYYNSAITLEKYERNVIKGLKSRPEYERLHSDLQNSIASRLKSLKETKAASNNPVS
jgi:hypothetical protein